MKTLIICFAALALLACNKDSSSPTALERVSPDSEVAALISSAKQDESAHRYIVRFKSASIPSEVRARALVERIKVRLPDPATDRLRILHVYSHTFTGVSLQGP